MREPRASQDENGESAGVGTELNLRYSDPWLTDWSRTGA
jgi:hypothetical protein